MTQERTGVSEGASVEATPATPPAQIAQTADTPMGGAAFEAARAAATGTFTLEGAKAEIERLMTEHDATQSAEHRAPTAIELGQKQRQDLEAELLASHNAAGPVQQLHGLRVIPVDQPDHVALVYSGVAGA